MHGCSIATLLFALVPGANPDPQLVNAIYYKPIVENTAKGERETDSDVVFAIHLQLKPLLGRLGNLQHRTGYLSAPAYSVQRPQPGPTTPYRPQVGDLLLLSNPDAIWSTFYFIAKTGRPGHAGIVVPMKDGQLGVLEAGYESSIEVRVTPLEQRLGEYKGTIWVRQRKTPLTEEQQRKLAEFSGIIDRRPYAVFRLLAQITPFRTRGPLRTFLFGKPHGIRDRYICSEAVLEALVYAGALDAETTRPTATYPQDMFYDRSNNYYINEHLRLKESWEIPALWHRRP